jgi:plastocyanin
MSRRFAIACAVVALLAGCSSGHGAAGSQQPAGSGTGGDTSTSTKPRCPSGQLGNGHFTLGRKVQITAKGFDPQVLVTGKGLHVVWTNTSSTTQSVHFDNWGSPVDSGPIPPGGNWTFHATSTGSVVYHSTYSPTLCGQLQIQLTGNGSEPGG